MIRYQQPYNWRAFANGDLYLDAARRRFTLRSSGTRFSLRCNGEFVALFDTVEAGKADAEVRATQLIVAAAEEDAWYASWPETAP